MNKTGEVLVMYDPGMLRAVNRLLKSHGLAIRARGSSSEMGDQRYLRIEKLTKGHFLIIGAATKQVIGCCRDQEDVLAEEPEGTTFKAVKKKDCPICGKDEG